MRLYQHSVRCRTAMQMFLDENQRYWRFVPMSEEEANSSAQRVSRTTFDMKIDNVRPREQVELFLKSLPTPPTKYTFSRRQQAQQYFFLLTRRDLIMPSMDLDLYNARIIAVSKYILQVFVRERVIMSFLLDI